jgi:hypothetical protein
MLKILGFLTIFIVSWSCTPVQESAEQCEPGETYSPVIRRCIDSSLLSDNAPVAAANQNFIVLEDTATNTIAINPGSDADGDALSYEVTSPPSYGTLTGCMNLTGSSAADDLTCQYTP